MIIKGLFTVIFLTLGLGQLTPGIILKDQAGASCLGQKRLTNIFFIFVIFWVYAFLPGKDLHANSALLTQDNQYCLSSVNTGIAGDDPLTIKTPNGGGKYTTGASITISWTSVDSIDTVDLHYTFDNGKTWKEIALNQPNTNSYAWIAPSITSDDCKVKVSHNHPDGPFDMSDSVFTIEQFHKIIVTYPNGGDSLFAGTQSDIKWATYGIIENVRIELSKDSGKTWIIIATKHKNNQVYSYPVPEINSRKCFAKVSYTADTTFNDISDSAFTIYSSIPIIKTQTWRNNNSCLSISPHPMLNTLNIQYMIEQQGLVTFTIYDLKGSLVKHMKNRFTRPGKYTIVWDGTDSHGQKVLSGSYILKGMLNDIHYSQLFMVLRK